MYKIILNQGNLIDEGICKRLQGEQADDVPEEQNQRYYRTYKFKVTIPGIQQKTIFKTLADSLPLDDNDTEYVFRCDQAVSENKFIYNIPDKTILSTQLQNNTNIITDNNDNIIINNVIAVDDNHSYNQFSDDFKLEYTIDNGDSLYIQLFVLSDAEINLFRHEIQDHGNYVLNQNIDLIIQKQ